MKDLFAQVSLLMEKPGGKKLLFYRYALNLRFPSIVRHAKYV